MAASAAMPARTTEAGWARHLSRLPWLVLLVGLFFSFWVSQQVQGSAKSALAAELSVRADGALTLLNKRLQLYEQILRGTTAMLATTGSSGPHAFEDYVRNSQMLQRLPGVVEIGYAEYADSKSGEATQPAPILARSRAQRTPLLRLKWVHSELAAEHQFFDVGLVSRVPIQELMLAAMESGNPVLSQHLSNAGNADQSAVFVMVLPVFEGGRDWNAEQRSHHILGWVLAPIRIQELMHSTFYDDAMAREAPFDIHVHDGDVAKPENVIYGKDIAGEEARGFFQERFHAERRFQNYGRTLLLQFTARAPLQQQLNSTETVIVPAVAALVSVLGALITWLIVRGREGAMRVARQEHQLASESELRFRVLGDAAPVKIRLTDSASALIWLNLAWREFFGLDPAARPDYWDQVHPQDRDQFNQTVLAGVAARQAYTHAYRIRDVHGNYRWMLETGVPRSTSEGQFQGYVACSMDVTQQKEQALDLLHKSEELERIFAATPDGLLIADQNGCIQQVNPQFTAMMGYHASEVIGQPVEMLIPAELRRGHSRHVTQFMCDPAVRVMNSRSGIAAQRKDGRRISIDIALSPVVRQGLPCVIATIRDATDRIRAQQVMNEALKVAEEASQAKSDFVANVSHELRTPLNGILGMAELTLQTDLTAAQAQYLQMLRTAAQNLLSIVNAVLEFSRTESGKLQLEDASFDLDLLIAQFGKSLNSLAHEKNLNWVCDIDPQVPRYLRGDAGRLRQILLNLVGNAIKFTDHGEVVLRVAMQSAAQGPGVCLHFSVQDTGIGIPEAKLESIFQKFSQADASTTRLYGGTGLGLAICRNLVQLLGGDIWVESVEGVGSTFHFTARLQCDPDAPTPACSTELQSLVAWVFDPHPTSRGVLCDLLQAQGMNALAYDRAEDAVQATQLPAAPAVVVVDAAVYNTPAFMQLQHEAMAVGPRNLAVILLTSQLEAPSGGAAELPVPWVLMKPFCRHELLDCILALRSDRPQGPAHVPQDGERAAQPLKILVAEDNQVNAFLATTVLRARGHTVLHAKDGLQAVELAQKERPDLILMDVQMPHMDGVEATRCIRRWEQQHGGHMRILTLSANVLESDKRISTDAGVDGHLGKPYQQFELVAAVEQGVAVQGAVGLPGGTAAAVAVDHEPLLAEHLLDQLIVQSGGNQALTGSLLEACEEDLAERFEVIGQAYDAADCEALYRAAHAAKGMVSVFSRGVLAEALMQLERLARQGDLQQVLAMRAALNVAHQGFHAKIQAMRALLAVRQQDQKAD